MEKDDLIVLDLFFGSRFSLVSFFVFFLVTEDIHCQDIIQSNEQFFLDSINSRTDKPPK